MKPNNAAEKYLATYAEPEIRSLQGLPAQARYQQVLVIPACNEAADFLERIPPTDQSTLLILVINQGPQAAPRVTNRNQRLAESAKAFGCVLFSATEPAAIALYHNKFRSLDLLVVDRFSPGAELPAKGGVGQARKIGADLALALINSGQVASPWIHNTDADTRLPPGYFESGQDRHSHAAAVLFPFKHQCDPADAVGRATALYEFSLFYYVAGLRWAGSPYAFQTVGSSFAVHAQRYAQVRGFPKRAAAEDFYMLNKLAKVAPIIELDCEPIMIRARTSDRVPFGTGAAVNQMLEMQDPVLDYRFYDPQVFACLQVCLAALQPLWQQRTVGPDSLLKIIRAGNELPLPVTPQGLVGLLNSIGMPVALEHAFRQSGDADQFRRQIHNWFDAFRTLKLVHLLRDNYYPSVSLQKLQAQSLFREVAPIDPH